MQVTNSCMRMVFSDKFGMHLFMAIAHTCYAHRANMITMQNLHGCVLYTHWLLLICCTRYQYMTWLVMHMLMIVTIFVHVPVFIMVFTSFVGFISK